RRALLAADRGARRTSQSELRNLAGLASPESWQTQLPVRAGSDPSLPLLVASSSSRLQPRDSSAAQFANLELQKKCLAPEQAGKGKQAGVVSYLLRSR